ncbi:hypothetical protein RND81_06G064700 [Saponaria officinalis]|uniref:Bifunctional inhibitor/plant lipid transfer protein/seed storage helical domain-containing protein n=1 Tax=Saponaria officinalis TaxID=3572 RepID=A0AAW1K806_SAPOF
MVHSPSLALNNGILIVSFLILICHLTLTNAQTVTSDPSALTPPTMAECGPSLFPLAPCGPFVQGQSPQTTLQCCQNLAQAYHDQPACLCLFLNGTALASLPINSTRALQLPGLCDVQIDSSTCSSSSGGSVPPIAPSVRRNPTTITAGAPTVTIAPRPSTVRFGMGQSTAYKLAGCQFGVAAAMSLLLETLL